jgi:hypothetical protein
MRRSNWARQVNKHRESKTKADLLSRTIACQMRHGRAYIEVFKTIQKESGKEFVYGQGSNFFTVLAPIPSRIDKKCSQALSGSATSTLSPPVHSSTGHQYAQGTVSSC